MIAGHFLPATGSAPASAAGTWRENIVLASGPQSSCTSNDQNWTATLYREPAQPKTVVLSGNYSGESGQNGGGEPVTFSVAPGARSLLNVSIPTTLMSCTPSGGESDHLGFLHLGIEPDGSFSATASQVGLFSGSKAKFTYSFAGYFEGPTPAGAGTVAGLWREDIVFTTGGVAAMCSSDNQSWTATLRS
jgi:hypothetical protein